MSFQAHHPLGLPGWRSLVHFYRGSSSLCYGTAHLADGTSLKHRKIQRSNQGLNNRQENRKSCFFHHLVERSRRYRLPATFRLDDVGNDTYALIFSHELKRDRGATSCLPAVAGEPPMNTRRCHRSSSRQSCGFPEGALHQTPNGSRFYFCNVECSVALTQLPCEVLPVSPAKAFQQQQNNNNRPALPETIRHQRGLTHRRESR